MPRRLSTALAAALAAALSLAAAAGGAPARPAAGPTVFAAASLTRVLPQIAPGAAFQFAGSNTLALQIEQGAPADVFIAASPKYVLELQAKGLTDGRPAWFATNRLVLMVPRANPARIRKPADLARPGVRLVIAAQGVPAGDLARKSLHGMKLDAALANVVSDEPDVEGVVSKVAAGEADAGFAYATDAKALSARVTLIPLPPPGHYVTAYGAIVVAHAPHLAAARALLAALRGRAGQAKLHAAGFGPPPKT